MTQTPNTEIPEWLRANRYAEALAQAKARTELANRTPVWIRANRNAEADARHHGHIAGGAE